MLLRARVIMGWAFWESRVSTSLCSRKGSGGWVWVIGFLWGKV